VLFEMLTGHRAFSGEGVADTLAFILTKEPAWDLLPPETPPSIRRLLRRCLERDRTRRLADIADARLDLDEGVADGTGSEAALAPPSRSPNTFRRWLPWSIATAGIATALWLAGVTLFDQPAPDTRMVRSSILLPARLGTRSGGTLGANLALSPDGRRLAFVATDTTGRRQLWLRTLDGSAARPLADTEDAFSPFWSHDSRWLAFVANGKLKKMDPSGGPAVTLCESALSGGTWNRDDIILFTQSTPQSLAQVSAAGGAPSTVTALDAKDVELRHANPYFLPDGRHFVYVAIGFSADQLAVYVGSLDSAQRSRLPLDAAFVQYAQGFLLFARGSTLIAQPFDERRYALVGAAVPVAEQLRVGLLASFFSVSATGMLVFHEDPSPGNELVWFDREGRPTGTLGTVADYADLSLSPDGRRALVSIAEPGTTNRDLWIFDVARGLRTRFTSDPAPETHNVWSPDGGRIVFDSRRKGGHRDMYQKASNGTGDEEVLLEDEFDKNPRVWSPDGRFILYIRRSPNPNIWVLPLTGDRKPFPFRETPSGELPCGFSPDGRWVAYFSNESGRTEVYVSPFPGPGEKTLISTAGGFDATWSRDGKEIFYLSRESKLMVAAVSADGDRFEVGDVTPLFDLPKVGPRAAYDVSPDGQRILAVTQKTQAGLAPLTLVVNWPALLNK
jgi:Tol biopolymer transport system component